MADSGPWDQYRKPAEDGPWTQYAKPAPTPESTEPQTSAVGAAKHGFVRSVLPTAAGLITGVGAGTLAGGATLNPVVGGAVGIGAGMAASAGVEKAQDMFLKAHPHVAEFLGLNEEQAAAEQKEHPYASMIGELAPNLVAFRPSLSVLGKLAGKAGTTEAGVAATKLARTNALFNAGLGGGLETAQEAVGDQPMDPTKIAIATASGALGQKETKLGGKLIQAGEAPVHALADKALDYIEKSRANKASANKVPDQTETTSTGVKVPVTSKVPTPDDVLSAFNEVKYSKRTTKLVMDKFGVDKPTALGVLKQMESGGTLQNNPDKYRWDIVGEDGKPRRDLGTPSADSGAAAGSSATDAGGTPTGDVVPRDNDAANNAEAAATGSEGLGSNTQTPPAVDAGAGASHPSVDEDAERIPFNEPTTVARAQANPVVARAPEDRSIADLLADPKVSVMTLKKAARGVGLDAPLVSKHTKADVIKMLQDHLAAQDAKPVAPVAETAPAAKPENSAPDIVMKTPAEGRELRGNAQTPVDFTPRTAKDKDAVEPVADKKEQSPASDADTKTSEASEAKPGSVAVTPLHDTLLKTVNWLISKAPGHHLDALAELKDELLDLPLPRPEPENDLKLQHIKRELAYYKPQQIDAPPAVAKPPGPFEGKTTDELEHLLLNGPEHTDPTKDAPTKLEAVMGHLTNTPEDSFLRKLARFVFNRDTAGGDTFREQRWFRSVKDEAATAVRAAKIQAERDLKVQAKLHEFTEANNRAPTPEERAALDASVPKAKVPPVMRDGTFANIKLNVEGAEGHDAEAIARLHKEGKAGEYDAKTNTIHLTRDGMNDKTIMHEVVHAMTVDAVKRYMTDPASLLFKNEEGSKYAGTPDFEYFRARKNEIFNDAIKALKEKNVRITDEVIEKLTNEAHHAAYKEAMNKFYPGHDEKIKAEYDTAVREYREKNGMGVVTPDERAAIRREVTARHAVLGDIKPTHGATEAERKVNRKADEKSSEASYTDTSVLKAAQMVDLLHKRVSSHVLYKAKHKEALSNLYEFISHAMTDPEFQKDLAKIRINPDDSLYTARHGKYASVKKENAKFGARSVSSVWNALTDAIKGIFGIRSEHQVGNVMLEMSEAFNDLLRAPGNVEGVEPLSAKKNPNRIKAPAGPAASHPNDEHGEARIKGAYALQQRQVEGLGKPKKTWYQKFEDNVTTLQSSRRALKALQDALRMAGIDFEGYDHTMLSTGVAAHLSKRFIDHHNDVIKKALQKYADLKGIQYDEAAARVSTFLKARHAPERMQELFLKNSPLDEIGKFPLALPDKDGNLVTESRSAAGHRDFIHEQLAKEDVLTEAKHVFRPGEKPKSVAEELHRQLEDLVFQRDATGELVRDANGDLLPSKYVTANGKSPHKKEGKGTPTNINDPIYAPTGDYSKVDLASIKGLHDKELADPALRKQLDAIDGARRAVQDATRLLNRRANYWTQPVDNWVNFYGFKDWVTFKGKPDANDPVSSRNDHFEWTGKRLGSGYADAAAPVGGRQSDSNNVLFETMADGVRAAMNNGRKMITGSVKDLHEKYPSLVDKKGEITFDQRQKAGEDLAALKEKGVFFHYEPDGKIGVYQVKDPALNEAIRRSYHESSSIVERGLDALGYATRMVSMGHTRYNPAFAPYNFIRHSLTNTFAITADMGPVAGARFLGRVTSKIADGGLFKAFQVAHLYETGQHDKLAEMAKTDPFIRDINEYIERGGRSSYITGLSQRSQYDEVMRELKATNGFAKTGKMISTFADHYGDMFELSTRAAAFSVVKDMKVGEVIEEYKNTHGEAGLEDYIKTDEFANKVADRSAAYTKELINYEHSGTYGRQLGNLFSFWRANATGAVRAMDSLLPAFMSPDHFINNLPKELQHDYQVNQRVKAYSDKHNGAEPPEDEMVKILADPAVVKAREAQSRLVTKFKERQGVARLMIASLIGAGTVAYEMSLAGAENDEQGRNKVAIDDKSMWVRNWRIPVPKGLLGKDNDYVQIPWGFGAGALAGIGAQIAALAHGHVKAKDMAGNIAILMRDSYLPLPTAEFNPADDPSAWITDSILPSVLRPIAEYKMNVDTFGRQVHNNQMTKYGSAYEGGDYIPQMYQQASRRFFEMTGVALDPATMHFFASNYADGYVRVAQNATDLGMAATGFKDFDPKTALLPFGNFIGKTTDFDAHKYGEVEKDLKAKQAVINMLQTRPDQLRAYMAEHPNDMMLVHTYEKINNGPLKKIRSEIHRLQSSDRPPAEYADRVRDLKQIRDMVARRMNDIYDEHQD